jgi:hypothetical protein
MAASFGRGATQPELKGDENGSAETKKYPRE